MAQTQVLKAKGLYTFPNDFSEVPEGGLLEAQNVEIKREGIIEPRRGFESLAHLFSSGTARQLIDYKSTLIAHYDTNKLAYYSASTGWNDFSGTYNEPDNALSRIHKVEANNNLYITTSLGIKKLETATSTPIEAGLPQALDGEGSLVASPGDFFTVDNQIAYRAVWGYKDANNNLILSAPSSRIVLANPAAGSVSKVQIIFTIPDGITTDHFLQVYRSDLSGGESIEPTDTMQLALETNPTSADITAKTITITDIQPDSLRGAYLYTSETQEGILQSNYRPPWAKDIDLYRGYVFFANCKRRHNITITIVSVGGASGIQIDDTITIAGTTYTAKATETIASAQFKIYTAGTVAQNIADTAQSLVRVINRYSSNTSVYAYYTSGYNDLPGRILIEERTIGGNSFAITSSNGGTYRPILPTTGTSISSENNEEVNALYFSKFEQSEHVPIVNKLLVGSANYPIMRIVALRDALIIFKPDAIYKLTGFETNSFRIDTLDSTTNLLAPDSAVPLNNTVFALTTQGVVSVSDTGVTIKSRSIEDKFLAIYGINAASLQRATFAIPYEADRKYILFTISNTLDSVATQAFVYNLFTNAWTTWDLSKTCGMVNSSDGKLYTGDATNSYVSKERKSFSYRDYIDEGFENPISSQPSSTTVILNSTNNVAVGDLIYQSVSVYSIVTAIDPITQVMTFTPAQTFNLGATTTIYKTIPCVVEWAPQYADNIYMNKHYREVLLLFKESFFNTAQVGFRSNLSPAIERVDLDGQAFGLWGQFPWGGSPWGGTQFTKLIRTYIPREKQRCAWIKVRFEYARGFGKFLLDGISYVFTPMSEKVSK